MTKKIDGIIYGKHDDVGATTIAELFGNEVLKSGTDDDGFPDFTFVEAMDEDLLKSKLESASLKAGARMSEGDKSGHTTKLVVGPKL